MTRTRPHVPGASHFQACFHKYCEYHESFAYLTLSQHRWAQVEPTPSLCGYGNSAGDPNLAMLSQMHRRLECQTLVFSIFWKSISHPVAEGPRFRWCVLTAIAVTTCSREGRNRSYTRLGLVAPFSLALGVEVGKRSLALVSWSS